MRERIGMVGGRSAFVFLAAVVAVLLTLTVPAGALGAGPTALWQRCDGSTDDLSCSLPRGIGVSPVSGDLYVADNNNSRVDQYTAWGEFKRAWGWGVANGAAEAQICTTASACKAGIQGGHSGQLGGLQGIAVDPAGNVYVAEFANHRVQKFDSEGHFILMFGGKVNKTKVEESKPVAEQNLCTALSGDVCQAGVEGSGPGEFGPGVTGGFIATGSTSNNVVYVGDKGKVEVFNPDGTFKENFPDPKGIIAAEGRVQSLIPAPGKGLFLAFSGKADVIRLTEAGNESCRVNKANPTPLKVPTALAMAVNAEGEPTGSLYVYDNEEKTTREVRQFSANCVGKSGPTGAPFAKDDVSNSTGLAAGVACLESKTATKEGADVYLSNSVGGGFVRAYGPAPDKTSLPSCEKPHFAPAILAQYAVSVGTVEATLGTQVNPRFYADTTFQLQYATAACIKGGGWAAPCVKSKPSAPASLGAEAVDFPFNSPTVEIAGLTPATEYSFRFIAESLGGGPVVGAERNFTTLPSSSPLAACPNEAFRTGGAALLPDCRAYELVSPVDKEGGEILTFPANSVRPAALDRSAVSGDKLTYSSYTPFADAQSAPYSSQYIADREAGVGWSSEAISPPRGTNFTGAGSGGTFPGSDVEFEAFSDDLCSGWLLRDNTTAPVLAAGAAPFDSNYYRRANCGAGTGSYETLGRAIGGPTRVTTRVLGISADGEKTIVQTNAHLSQDAASAAGTSLRCISPTPVAVSYQWLREGVPIGGATTSAYVATAADEGKTVQCQIRASGGGAGTVGDANPAWVIAPYPASAPPKAPQSIPAPGASAAPAVGGAGGQKLGCDPDAAAWEGSPAFAYRWYRNGEAIAGAESNKYTVQPGDLTSVATFQCEVIATNAGGTVAATSEALASSPAPAAPVARTSMWTADPVLYETLGEGRVRAVCVLPSGIQSNGCTAGTASQFGSFAGSASGAMVDGAFSEDGSRVFWTSPDFGEGKVYARIEGKTTVEVSQAATSEPARFWTAAADGSAAIVSSAGKLYEIDLSEPQAPVSTTIAEGFAGVVGASRDASLLYFVSTKALAGAAQEGKPNLYLRRTDGGEGLSFIGTLAVADIPKTFTGLGGGTGLSPVAVEPYEHAARTSDDGDHLAFISRASLTGYDNADAASGVPDVEVFVYDAQTGKLACASCNPSGARPVGRVLAVETSEAPALPTAAQLPPIQSQLYASRVLAEDGSRLFFESVDALVSADTNGKIDVYEWEAPGAGACSKTAPAYSARNEGCVSLISSGKSQADSTLLDASPSGHDVFFTTGAGLLPSDPGSIDIYDAREGGGLPLAPVAQRPCEGEACPTPPPPATVTPASAAFRGAGNEKPRKRCGKGRRRVVRKGKAHCVKRHHRKHHRKRTQPGHRGAAR